MRKFALCAALIAVLMLDVGCGNRDQVGNVKIPLDETFTTTFAFDPGVVHNEILTEMHAVPSAKGTLTRAEYLERAVSAANKVFARYGASRPLTVEDCRFVLGIGRSVNTLYDLWFEDPERADPVRPITYWHDQGLIKDEEFAQIKQVFTDAAEGRIGTISVPVSENTAGGISVFQASMEYWGKISAAPGTEPGRPDPEELRRMYADGLGGLIGGMLGGPIAAGLVSMGLSTLFMMEQEQAGMSEWDPDFVGPHLPPPPDPPCRMGPCP